MCGIAGFINFGGHDQAEARARLKRMTDTLVHRGPDDEGFYVDDKVALGHRRLSIIDLASGHQPMSTADQKLQIVFNGEVYNYPELKKELESKGHRFRTQSDTETILYAYREWGEQCVERLNGMFAFAIWDKDQQHLFLARDRVGKKPLYYHWDGEMFSFASELKAMRATNLCPSDIDFRALDCYFTFGYIPAPMTIYRNVHKLAAAHILTVKSSGIATRRYWNLQFLEPNTNSDTILSEFEEIFDRAIQCRLMSEVPLGAFLSGGIDSTLVVSSMAKFMQQPVQTNTIGFAVDGYNEIPVARIVANFLGTNHREFIVEPKVADVLKDISWHFDEPFADSSAVPTWYVCQMARRNVTVALSGDGGDENFGGYTFRYTPHVFESYVRSLIPYSIRKALFGSLGYFYPASASLPKPLRLKTVLENLATTDVGAFYNDLVWLRSDLKRKVYSKEFQTQLKGFSPFEVVQALYQNPEIKDPLNRCLYADINFYMTDNCLVKVDRMSMAHSLEVRSPLLDHRIMEFAATLPVRLKLAGTKGKILLRRLAARRLPREVLRQPKRGFSIPVADWLRHELRELAEQAFGRRNSFSAQFLDREQLNTLWQEHLSGSRDHSVFLWGLLMLDFWANSHFDYRVPGGA